MEHQYSVNEERKNRFATSSASTGADTPRSASQPPTTNGGEGFYAPAMQIFGSPNLDRNGTNKPGGNLGSPWAMSSGRVPAMTRSSSIGIPSAVSRSSSFSSSSVERAASYAGGFGSAMRDSHSFPSTFEDDESEALSDATGDYSPYPDASMRGRNYLGTIDPRSRSQSLATTTATRPLPIGSPPSSAGWAVPGPLSIPGRFHDVKSFGAAGLGSRYNSFGGEFSRSPVPSPTGLRVQQQHRAEISNISPLARDIGQIMYDEEWMRNGGDSGATSRRHSVSGGLQARRGIIGFNAPDTQNDSYYTPDVGSAGSGGLAVDDDDLAATINSMSLNGPENGASTGRSHAQPISQPSSLPIYAPLSQAAKDQQGSVAESLHVTTGGLTGRMRSSPSEGAYSGTGEGGSTDQSPALDQYAQRQQMQGQGQGQRYMQYVPEEEEAEPRMSPTFVRSAAGPNASFMHMQAGPGPTSPTRQLMQQMQLLHQQQLANASPIQRRSSQSEMLLGAQQAAQMLPHVPVHNLVQAPQPAPPPPVSELGRGIPLHAVPPSWTLYIVEFKAGRTDLFYVADSDTSVPPLRVGDLVIVEADRGKDLGKVVNDSITAAEVEAFQRQQAAAVQAQAYNEFAHGHGGGPVSPEGVPVSPTAGPGASKREINPKKIYGKASPQEAQ